MFDNSCCEEIFNNIQTKPPLVQLEDFFSYTIGCKVREEPKPYRDTTFFQIVAERNKVIPELLFLQAELPLAASHQTWAWVEPEEHPAVRKLLEVSWNKYCLSSDFMLKVHFFTLTIITTESREHPSQLPLLVPHPTWKNSPAEAVSSV